jgi:hypothetical protein
VHASPSLTKDLGWRLAYQHSIEVPKKICVGSYDLLDTVEI